MLLRRLSAAVAAALVVVTVLAAAPATAAPAVRLVVTAGSPSVRTGSSVAVTVTAVASDGTVDTSYAGTVGFSSSDASAGLPAGGPLTSGSGSFLVSLTTLGTQTITATDTVTNTITGTASVIVFGPLSRLAIAATAAVPVNGTATVTVTGLDVNGNTVNTASDTVQLISSTNTALASGPLAGGVATLLVSFTSAGKQTITAVDTSNTSVGGASAVVTVYGPVSTLSFSTAAPTAGARQPITVTAIDSAGVTVASFADQLQLTSSDTKAEISAAVVATNGIASFTVIFHTPGPQTITALDIYNNTMSGTSSVTVADKPLTRVAGTTRLGTAIAASQQAFTSGGATAVVLARADAFADALAGGPLADAKSAPLLLNPSAALDPAVKTEIERVLPRNRFVYLLGGTAALDPSIADALIADGYQVVRFAGANRYETAVSIARDGLGRPSTVILATGNDFADALSAGPAATEIGAALLLTDGSTLPPATASYLAAAGTVYAVGRPASLAAPSAIAIVGADRYATAAAVASQWFGSATAVGFASGTAFPDALAGGAHIGAFEGPMLLVDPAASTVPSSTSAFLSSVRDTTTSGFVYGGEGAVSAPLMAAIAAAAD